MADTPGIETRMDAASFMAWYDLQPDGPRYELLNGRAYEMQRECVGHARVKGACYAALVRAAAARGLPCEVFADGMAVRLDNTTIFQPDVTVRCGPRLPGETALILDPAIVVEVLSTTIQPIDVFRKFNGYFRNPGMVHYLIVNSVDGGLVHHRRAPDGRIESAHRASGVLELDPPGLSLDLDELFGADAAEK